MMTAMWPHEIRFAGAALDIWNAVFLLAVVVGYPLLLWTLRLRPRAAMPNWLPVRWLITVYAAAIGAQLFAYLFDLNTTLLPPPNVSALRYYLDPLAGPKTLYGAVLFLPVGILAVTVPWRDLGYVEGLDAWTPPMFAVLAVCRVGCFLQGCCYGVRSDHFGVAFPPNSLVYWEQLRAGLIQPGMATLPVVPTQLLSAGALAVLAVWSAQQLRRGRRNIFPLSIALYSLFRFAIEFLRADPDRNTLGVLSTSQWIALLVVTVVGLGLSRLRPVAAA